MFTMIVIMALVVAVGIYGFHEFHTPTKPPIQVADDNGGDC